jgi:hypothetical protein
VVGPVYVPAVFEGGMRILPEMDFWPPLLLTGTVCHDDDVDEDWVLVFRKGG